MEVGPLARLGRQSLFMTLLMRNISEDDFLAKNMGWWTCKGVQM